MRSKSTSPRKPKSPYLKVSTLEVWVLVQSRLFQCIGGHDGRPPNFRGGEYNTYFPTGVSRRIKLWPSTDSRFRGFFTEQAPHLRCLPTLRPLSRCFPR